MILHDFLRQILGAILHAIHRQISPEIFLQPLRELLRGIFLAIRVELT